MIKIEIVILPEEDNPYILITEDDKPILTEDNKPIKTEENE